MRSGGGGGESQGEGEGVVCVLGGRGYRRIHQKPLRPLDSEDIVTFVAHCSVVNKHISYIVSSGEEATVEFIKNLWGHWT